MIIDQIYLDIASGNGRRDFYPGREYWLSLLLAILTGVYFLGKESVLRELQNTPKGCIPVVWRLVIGNYEPAPMGPGMWTKKGGITKLPDGGMSITGGIQGDKKLRNKFWFRLFLIVLTISVSLAELKALNYFMTIGFAGVTRFSVATGNWNATSTWSATSGGASGASVPGTGDTAIIEGGFTVTVSAVQTIGNVTVGAAGSGTLAFSTNTLSVEQDFLAEDGTIPLSASGKLEMIGTTAANFQLGTNSWSNMPDITFGDGSAKIITWLSGTISSVERFIGYGDGNTMIISNSCEVELDSLGSGNNDAIISGASIPNFENNGTIRYASGETLPELHFRNDDVAGTHTITNFGSGTFAIDTRFYLSGAGGAARILNINDFTNGYDNSGFEVIFQSESRVAGSQINLGTGVVINCADFNIRVFGTATQGWTMDFGTDGRVIATGIATVDSEISQSQTVNINGGELEAASLLLTETAGTCKLDVNTGILDITASGISVTSGAELDGGTSGTINCSGAWNIDSGSIWTEDGSTVNFSGTGNITLSTVANAQFNNVSFDGTRTLVTNDIRIDGTLEFKAGGTLNGSGRTVDYRNTANVTIGGAFTWGSGTTLFFNNASAGSTSSNLPAMGASFIPYNLTVQKTAGTDHTFTQLGDIRASNNFIVGLNASFPTTLTTSGNDISMAGTAWTVNAGSIVNTGGTGTVVTCLTMEMNFATVNVGDGAWTGISTNITIGDTGGGSIFNLDTGSIIFPSTIALILDANSTFDMDSGTVIFTAGLIVNTSGTINATAPTLTGGNLTLSGTTVWNCGAGAGSITVAILAINDTAIFNAGGTIGTITTLNHTAGTFNGDVANPLTLSSFTLNGGTFNVGSGGKITTPVTPTFTSGFFNGGTGQIFELGDNGTNAADWPITGTDPAGVTFDAQTGQIQFNDASGATNPTHQMNHQSNEVFYHILVRGEVNQNTTSPMLVTFKLTTFVSATSWTIPTGARLIMRDVALTDFDNNATITGAGTLEFSITGATKTITNGSDGTGDTGIISVAVTEFKFITATGPIALGDKFITTGDISVLIDGAGSSDEFTLNGNNLTAKDITVASLTTLNGSNNTITCKGNWNLGSGTFTVGNSTVQMTDGTSTMTIGANSNSFYKLIINPGGGNTVSISGTNTNAVNDFDVITGTFELAAAFEFSIQDVCIANFSNAGLITGIDATSKLKFRTSNATVRVLGAVGTITTIQIEFNSTGSTSNIDLGAALSVTTSDITVVNEGGTSVELDTAGLAVSCVDFTVDTGGTVTPGASTFTLTGDWDSTGGLFNGETSLVKMTGNGSSINASGSDQFFDLEINVVGTVSSGTLIEITRQLVLTLGNFDISGDTMRFIRASGTPITGAGALTGTSGVTQFAPAGVSSTQTLEARTDYPLIRLGGSDNGRTVSLLASITCVGVDSIAIGTITFALGTFDLITTGDMTLNSFSTITHSTGSLIDVRGNNTAIDLSLGIYTPSGTGGFIFKSGTGTKTLDVGSNSKLFRFLQIDTNADVDYISAETLSIVNSRFNIQSNAILSITNASGILKLDDIVSNALFVSGSTLDGLGLLIFNINGAGDVWSTSGSPINIECNVQVSRVALTPTFTLSEAMGNANTGTIIIDASVTVATDENLQFNGGTISGMLKTETKLPGTTTWTFRDDLTIAIGATFDLDLIDSIGLSLSFPNAATMTNNGTMKVTATSLTNKITSSGKLRFIADLDSVTTCKFFEHTGEPRSSGLEIIAAIGNSIGTMDNCVITNNSNVASKGVFFIDSSSINWTINECIFEALEGFNDCLRIDADPSNLNFKDSQFLNGTRCLRIFNTSFTGQFDNCLFRTGGSSIALFISDASAPRTIARGSFLNCTIVAGTPININANYTMDLIGCNFDETLVASGGLTPGNIFSWNHDRTNGKEVVIIGGTVIIDSNFYSVIHNDTFSWSMGAPADWDILGIDRNRIVAQSAIPGEAVSAPIPVVAGQQYFFKFTGTVDTVVIRQLDVGLGTISDTPITGVSGDRTVTFTTSTTPATAFVEWRFDTTIDNSFFEALEIRETDAIGILVYSEDFLNRYFFSDGIDYQADQLTADATDRRVTYGDIVYDRMRRKMEVNSFNGAGTDKAGHIYGFQNSDNYYRIYMDDTADRILLEKVVGGTPSEIDRTTASLPSGDGIKFETRWNDATNPGEFEVLINDVNQTWVTGGDTTAVSKADVEFTDGLIGYYLENVSIDNVIDEHWGLCVAGFFDDETELVFDISASITVNADAAWKTKNVNINIGENQVTFLTGAINIQINTQFADLDFTEVVENVIGVECAQLEVTDNIQIISGGQLNLTGVTIKHEDNTAFWKINTELATKVPPFDFKGVDFINLLTTFRNVEQVGAQIYIIDPTFEFLERVAKPQKDFNVIRNSVFGTLSNIPFGKDHGNYTFTMTWAVEDDNCLYGLLEKFKQNETLLEVIMPVGGLPFCKVVELEAEIQDPSNPFLHRFRVTIEEWLD